MDALRSLKISKAPCFHEIDVNVINQLYNDIKKPLIRIFDDLIKLKLSKVTPIFKSGKKELLTNYRRISVLPCFSKILERIMYNRRYEHLTKNNLLFDKEFGFRKGHSTERAIIELANRIYESFNENKYTFGVLVDLSKAFGKVNQNLPTKANQP